jgi:MFS family permease
MISAPTALRRWGTFAIVSAIFFHITGSTFTSLGVVLPYMIKDLSWSWTNAGLGFTLLALLTGLASTLPTWMLRNFGIKATYGIGGAIMAIGFSLLAMTTGLNMYFLGTSLLGVGFASCATVPALHVLNEWSADRRSFIIGAFMTIGGLGGVAGPLVVTGIVGATGSWRVHWWVMTATILLLTLLAVIFVKCDPHAAPNPESNDKTNAGARPAKVFRTSAQWNFRDAVRTPQYLVIVAAMTSILFCAVTMNTWAVTHMVTLGVSSTVAAGALSALSLVNALSRFLGGVAASRIDPKWLLISALVAEIISMQALAGADNLVTIALFAVAEGYASGMCYFAAIMLLVNYYGTRENAEILGTLNLITTIAMLGPVLGGFVGDTFGGFAPVFQGNSLLVLVILVITARMRPPRHERVELIRGASE